MFTQIFNMFCLGTVSLFLFSMVAAMGMPFFSFCFGLFLAVVFGANFLIAISIMFDVGGSQAIRKKNIKQIYSYRS